MKLKLPLCNKQSPVLIRALAVLVLLTLVFTYPVASVAISLEDGKSIPHVNDKAKESIVQYQSAGKHKAFAIAPGGAWSWRADASDEDDAELQALQSCQEYTQQKCVLYALNERIVFNAVKWPTLWGPYADKQSASRAGVGAKVGERFHDLTWKDAKGNKVHLSSLHGKLVFLHFWGSWCPPCLREFPSLKKMHAEIKTKFPSDVEMVMLQLREPFDESSAWAEQYKFSDLPLYDSGVADNEVTTLTLSDGSLIQDRNIARVFPSTYVLDRNGLIIFSHNGPVDDWLEYLPFLQHAVSETSKNVKAKARAAIE